MVPKIHLDELVRFLQYIVVKKKGDPKIALGSEVRVGIEPTYIELPTLSHNHSAHRTKVYVKVEVVGFEPTGARSQV